jgi:protocatechuate 3,4-dioxygenase beta subunit
LIITGVVYQSDGKTPLAWAVMYAYQTDADGYYSREQGGNRAPRLKGRLKTGADGRYEIRTIMPGHYPGGKVPSHIHASITPAGGKEVNIDEYLFDGDPFLSKEDYSKFAGRGPLSSLVTTVKGDDGVLRAVRDIIVNAR